MSNKLLGGDRSLALFGPISKKRVMQILGKLTSFSPPLFTSFGTYSINIYIRYTEGEAFITKILKDKQKLRKQNEKREKQEEAFRQRLAEDDDGLEEAEEAAAKKAKFEESRVSLQEKIKAQAGPPVFKQNLFPAEVQKHVPAATSRHCLTFRLHGKQGDVPSV